MSRIARELEVPEIFDRIAALYGAEAAQEMAGVDGVVHVTAVWRRADGGSTVLAINDQTPQSETDRFVLRVGRARADAIVTTGGILRAESDVLFRLDGPDNEALSRWRRDVRGRTTTPTVAVLTSGRDVDFEHPAFSNRAVVFTPATLDAPDHVQVCTRPAPTIRTVIADLKSMGHRTILIEAGPSTTMALYAPPRGLDELMLSEVWADELDPNVLAGEFLDESTLDEVFRERTSRTEREEHGRRWTFSRFSATR